MDRVKQKMDKTVHADSGSRRRNRRGMPSVHQVSVTPSTPTSDSEPLLMEQVVEPSNMQRAWSRVKSNSRFVCRVLQLTVNASKSTVDGPWNRSFLGYTVTWHRKTKLKPSNVSVQRFKSKVVGLCRQGRGRNPARFITDDLNPLLRGWGQYFKMSEVKGLFEDLDSWVRRRLRCLQWRQWKQPKTRLKKLVKRGLTADHAVKSAYNGRGPWWNAGAAHMNKAFPARYFERLNVVSLARTVRQADWLK